VELRIELVQAGQPFDGQTVFSPYLFVCSGLAGPGCHVATVGQLLFAPWAWAYLTLHP